MHERRHGQSKVCTGTALSGYGVLIVHGKGGVGEVYDQGHRVMRRVVALLRCRSAANSSSTRNGLVRESSLAKVKPVYLVLILPTCHYKNDRWRRKFA